MPSRELALGGLRAREFALPGVRGAAVVILHGFHKDGYDEPRLQRFARAFASEGVRVVVPDMQPVREYRMVSDAAEQVAAWIDFAAPAGVFGFSFAGGVGLQAAARSAAAFAVAWGSYADPADAMRFAFFGPGRDPYAARIICLNLCERLVPAPEVDGLRAHLVALIRKEPAPPPAPSSPEAQVVISGLADPASPEARALHALADAHAAPVYRAMDLRPALPRLRGPVFVGHGRDDAVVPASEALRLAAMLREAGAPLQRVLVSGAFTHVDGLARGGGWARALESARIVRFVAGVLRAARV